MNHLVIHNNGKQAHAFHKMFLGFLEITEWGWSLCICLLKFTYWKPAESDYQKDPEKNQQYK